MTSDDAYPAPPPPPPPDRPVVCHVCRTPNTADRAYWVAVGHSRSPFCGVACVAVNDQLDASDKDPTPVEDRPGEQLREFVAHHVAAHAAAHGIKRAKPIVSALVRRSAVFRQVMVVAHDDGQCVGHKWFDTVAEALAAVSYAHEHVTEPVEIVVINVGGYVRQFIRDNIEDLDQ